MAGLSSPGRWTRAGIGARAVLAALLAMIAALLAVEVADWRYLRVDLTARGSNTLDPAVLDVIDRLPEPVVVDVFLRPLKQPYFALHQALTSRLLGFLSIVHNARRAKIEVRIHDPRDFEEIQERQRELRTEGTNKIVLSCGGRRDELELFGELASIDWGNPSQNLARYLTTQGIPGVIDPRRWQPNRDFRPAFVREFHGEELFTQSLLKVSSGDAPRVYFLRGHGEPLLDGSEPTHFSRLSATLERDGFEVEEWDPLKHPAVPDDCSVLALIGPQQPYQASTRETIRLWALDGGRILAAPALDELQEGIEGGVVSVLQDFGVLTRPGLVCQPLVGFGGERVDGSEQCAWLMIDERGLQPGHPLTEPLRMRGRRVQFTLTPSFETAGLSAEMGVMLPLISSAADSWRDLPPYDFRFNPSKGEKRKRHTLVAVKQLRATRADDGAVRQGRVLAVASAFFFGNDTLDENRDFILLAFNWLAERDYRLAVAPLSSSISFLDFQRGSAKPILIYSLYLGLPGLCALVGLVIFMRRRS